MGSLKKVLGRLTVATTVIMVGVVVVGATDGSPPIVDAQDAVDNPDISETCGLDAVLVLDASGSIESSDAVDQVRDAGDAFLDALADTGSTARVLQFASLSQQLAPQTPVTQASVDTGVFRNALDAYYNPKPPRPGDVEIYSYDGNGDPQSAGNWRSSNSSNQYTNWDQSLGQAGQAQTNPIEIVVYVTDGDPTAYDFDQPGDPFSPGPPPDVGVNTNRGDADAVTMARAGAAANAIKSGATRMLAVGVGSALNNPESSARLEQISGPQVVDDDDLRNDPPDSINDVDVALVEDFDDLAAFLRGVVIELCTPSISISKYAQSPITGEYDLATDTSGVPTGWDITVTPSVDGGGTFTWSLPDLNPPAPPYACDLTGTAARTCPTNANGVANFQWQPDPPDAATSAQVAEQLQPGYLAGHPTLNDFRCQLKTQSGTTNLDGELTDDGGGSYSFVIPDVDPRAIVTCSIYNHFDFQPGIALTKADAPRSVRGDAEADAAGINETTSTFTVTNTGNAPLFNVDLTDDRCNAERDDATDVGSDDMLDVGESWTYTCTRTPTSAAGSAPIEIDNTADVQAVDASGTIVEADGDDAIEVYAAGIDLAKTAAPTQIPANVATDVTYTYTATNTGNMPLTDVTVTDDQGTQTCAPVTPAGVTLQPGASQDFSCTVSITPTAPTDTFTNTAVVTGQPEFPAGAPTPLGPTGDPVTAEASEVVTSFTEGIELTKSVTPDLIFDDTEVTYTYTVENTGSVDLENVVLTDDFRGAAPPINGFCANVQGPTDDDGDNLLNPQEIWTYTCTTTIDIDALDGSDRFVVNVADVAATAVGSGDELVDYAPAVVEIVTPEITIDKDVVPSAVLDADAIDPGPIPAGGAVSGPDVPTPRPAGYTYLVTNTGNVPIEDPAIDDVRPDDSPACAPITPVPPTGNNAGDANGDGILDPGEAWQYTCSTPLDKDDSDDPVDPTATEPGNVNNIATATGDAFIPNSAQPPREVSSPPDQAVVQVLQPQIDIQKTPCVRTAPTTLVCDDDPADDDNLLVRPNTVVTYQYLVTNTGDSDFTLQVGIDSLCDDIRYVSGGNGDLILTVGEQALYECDYEVGGLADSPVTNTVGVASLGPLGNVYADVDQATVEIFDPAIDVVKSVSDDFVPVGTEVTYTFEVTNIGEYAVQLGSPADVQLASVLLADVSSPANPACTSPTYVSGDVAPLDVLTVEPSETWVYTCTGTVDETTIDIAGVRGTDIAQGFVYDAAVASVTPYDAGIDIVKSATPTSMPAPGGPVTYSYDVTNTGNVPLADVKSRVVDDTCSPVTYVSGDDDDNELLTSATDLFETGPEETWIFECTTNVSQDTTNIVVVDGTPVHPTPDGPDPLGPDVTDNDTATVVVVPPTTTTTTVAPTIPPPTTRPTPPTLAPLPPTGGGSGSRSTLPIAVALLLGGAALVLVTRRRPADHDMS